MNNTITLTKIGATTFKGEELTFKPIRIKLFIDHIIYYEEWSDRTRIFLTNNTILVVKETMIEISKAINGKI